MPTPEELERQIKENELAASLAKRKQAEAEEAAAEADRDKDEGPGFLGSMFSSLMSGLGTILMWVVLPLILLFTLFGGGGKTASKLGDAIGALFHGDLDGAGKSAGEALDAAGNTLSGGYQSLASTGKAFVGRLTGNSKENATIAANYFQNAGWSSIATSGIVGNLLCESGVQTAAFNPNDPHGGSCGIAQWNGERKANFMRVEHVAIEHASLEQQLHFVNWELTEGPYKNVGAMLKNAKTAQQAGDIINRYYEISADSSMHRQGAAQYVAANIIPVSTPTNPNLSTASYLAK